MILSSIDPNEVQSSTLQWIGVGSAIVIALVTAVSTTLALVLPKLATIKTQVEGLLHSRDVQRSDIQANQAAIVDLAKAVPPPAPPTPAPSAPGQV